MKSLLRAGEALICGVALAVATTFPYVLHLRDALPGGVFDGPRQHMLWLPWQIWDNLRLGRGLPDSRSLPTLDMDLWQIVGNPGPALLMAPLHAIGEPMIAWNLGVLALVALNFAGAWRLARTFAGVQPLTFALLAGGGWAMAQLTAGAAYLAFLAPAFFAAAAFRQGAGRAGTVWALVGALLVPIPTLLALLWCGRRLLAGVCVVAFVLFPPLGGEPTALRFTTASLVWPGAGETTALSLGVLGCLVVVARRRRAVALALSALLLLAGTPVAVDGFVLAWPHLPPERLVVSVVTLLAALLALPHLRLRGAVAILVPLFLFVEPRLQVALGQPALPWTGVSIRIPESIAAIGAERGTGIVFQLPLGGVVDGAVGYIPFHHHGVSGGPGETIPGRARDKVLAQLSEQPRGGRLVPQSADWALLFGDDTEDRREARAFLGEPTMMEPGLWAWRLR